MRPGAAARERDRKRGRAGLELLRGERAGEDGAGFRDGWREDAGRVQDLCLAGPEEGDQLAAAAVPA